MLEKAVELSDKLKKYTEQLEIWKAASDYYEVDSPVLVGREVKFVNHLYPFNDMKELAIQIYTAKIKRIKMKIKEL